MRTTLPKIARTTWQPLLLILVFTVQGCATASRRVPFAWTSDDHLAPRDRVASVSLPPDSVTKQLANWARSRGGDVVSTEPCEVDEGPTEAEAAAAFTQLQTFVRAYWASFDARRGKRWEKSEWGRWEKMNERQTTRGGTTSMGWEVLVRVGDRDLAGVEKVRVGTQTTSTMIYSPGFTAYRPSGTGIGAVTVPGSMMRIPMTVPVFEDRTFTKRFFSSIRFRVVAQGSGSRVRAFGHPVDQSTGWGPGKGRTYDLAWWPDLSGRVEARYITEAFESLRRAEP